jgi:hypothetical protein
MRTHADQNGTHDLYALAARHGSLRNVFAWTHANLVRTAYLQ